VVTDIDTRWRQRQATIPALAHLLDVVAAAKRGRYLLCFPSYHYLRQFTAHLESSVIAQRIRFIAQKAGQEARQDASLLERLCDHDDLVLGIVLGGTLSESIDLIDTPLAGVIVVGVAQSPPSPQLDRAAAHFDSRGLDGHLMAYIQPGMSKIVQAAGRLIRTEQHRGVLLLVDGRFRQPAWRQFFPSLWEPRVVAARDVDHLVRDFWTDT
jgi:Rad3-related DNA helicase